ncbi:hypothetical protein HELRODRAFT_182960 [Helobdella robusta]|uniref:Fibrinogen C-terminal domain-containing protein n=1 Tax=Helobdella robusta TaxID=6412 RepID=T1FIZ9_HELRO|nr:hypothetical protein HELRODRAFT_182960 [Helobdella robusta]ESN89950.1 hypothetical protein HELRODRAFT_182960 [Helobdella robusta]
MSKADVGGCGRELCGCELLRFRKIFSAWGSSANSPKLTTWGDAWIHDVASTEARSVLVNINGVWYSDLFKTNSKSEKYFFNVSGYSGSKDDVLNYQTAYFHNGMKFSTPDQVNDQYVNHSCALKYSSGNWFNKCYYQNLDGPYGSVDFCYAFLPVTCSRLNMLSTSYFQLFKKERKEKGKKEGKKKRKKKVASYIKEVNFFDVPL